MASRQMSITRTNQPEFVQTTRSARGLPVSGGVGVTRIRTITAAVGLAAVAAAGVWLATPKPGGGLIMDIPETVGLCLTVGIEADVTIGVRDTSAWPLRIIGMQGLYTAAMCFRPRDWQQVTVPPGGVAGLPCVMRPTRAGPFREERVMYLEDPGLESLG